jgi:ornithine lipid ester-linked acyl 2-hydroxylase
LNGFLAHQSLVPHAPIHDNRSYQFLERFVENWPIIHNEVRAILKHREAIPLFQQVWADQSRIARGANWRTFILFGFGQKVGRNCNHAPVVMI